MRTDIKSNSFAAIPNAAVPRQSGFSLSKRAANLLIASTEGKRSFCLFGTLKARGADLASQRGREAEGFAEVDQCFWFSAIGKVGWGWFAVRS
jgi:hypothetical protein